MTQQEAQKLALGLYRIHWKDGSSSVAAVGMAENGTRWIAPTNWVHPTEDASTWRMVRSVTRLHA